MEGLASSAGTVRAGRGLGASCATFSEATTRPRARRCGAAARRAAWRAPRAEADNIELVEVQPQGDGRAVRAALEALRNKRRERELVGFYSMPAVERRLQQPVSDASDQLAALRERHQHDMTQLRTRLNTRLSKASAYTRHCDRAIRQRDAAMATLHEELLRMRAEVAELVQMAAASASDPKQASIKFVALGERAKVLQSGVASSLEHLDKQRVRAVEVSWSGMAEDVRVMGSFDGWTHGVPLSPHETGAYTLFTATLQLLPGSYEIKFLVDSQWRLAPDWPQAGEGDSANNQLVVGAEDGGGEGEERSDAGQ